MNRRPTHVLVALFASLAGFTACGSVSSHDTGTVPAPRTVPTTTTPAQPATTIPETPGPGPATRTSGVDPNGGVVPPGQPPGESGTRTP